MSKPSGKDGGNGEANAEKGEQGELVEWLNENGFKEYVAKFIDQGYEKAEIDDLEDKDIDTVLKDKTGVASQLKRALSKWRADHEKKEPETPEIPDLPEGAEFDLSLPKVKTANKTFEIPDALSVRANKAAVVSPIQLKKNDWIVIAKNSNLLYGFDMNKQEPERATSPVLWWKVPERSDFVAAEQLHAEATSTLVYSEKTENYVKQNFDTETASAGYAFAAGSFERSHEERSAGASVTKKLYMRAKYDYPRATLYLERCSKVSPLFKAGVENALKSADPATELGKVFAEYGHAVSRRVLLGGQLYFERVDDSSAGLTNTEMKQVYKAAAEITYDQAKGGAGVNVSAADATGKTQKTQIGTVHFTVFGGDTTLVSTPADWAKDVKQPSLWTVIARSDVIPTYELLDDDLRDKVVKLWAKMPPLFGWPLNLAWKENEGASDVTTSAFLIAMRNFQTDGDRGSVVVVSGPDKDPKEGDAETAAGAAFAHRLAAGNVFYDCNSVCIPVQAGYHYEFKASNGKPAGRLAFISSKVSFGKWGPVKFPFTAPRDGFLFASINTLAQECNGEVFATVDGIEVAGCSATCDRYRDAVIQRASLCVPTPAASVVDLPQAIRFGSPIVQSYWVPIDSENVKMQKMEVRSINTQFPATTDGILYGFVGSRDPKLWPSRASLKLYSYGSSDNPDSTPFAAASINYTLAGERVRLIRAASAMLPVRRGAFYKTVYENVGPVPASMIAKLFWTPIAPA